MQRQHTTGFAPRKAFIFVCDNYRVMPVELQKQCAALAGGSEIVACSAEYMVMLSWPEVMVNLVYQAAEGG
jgi:hypothetical protein